MKTIIVIGDNNHAGIAERFLARMIEKGIEHEVLTVDQAKERGIPVPPADYLEKMMARDSEEKELNKLIHSLRVPKSMEKYRNDCISHIFSRLLC